MKRIYDLGGYKRLVIDGKTGIAVVQDGSTSLGHSPHSSIDTTGSVRGMKSRGYWRKRDRVYRAIGYAFNVDTYSIDDDLDQIAATHCMCQACVERRERQKQAV